MISVLLMSQTEHLTLSRSIAYESYARSWSSRELLNRVANVSVNFKAQKFQHALLF
jgi:hypothetical protein